MKFSLRILSWPFLFMGGIGLGRYLVPVLLTSDYDKVLRGMGLSSFGQWFLTILITGGIFGIGLFLRWSTGNRKFQRSSPGERDISKGQFRLENQTKKCPSCAEEIKLDAKVCRYCGHQFSEEEVHAEKQKQQEQVAKMEKDASLNKLKKRGGIHFGLGVTFVIIGNLFFLLWIGMIFNYFKGDKTLTSTHVVVTFFLWILVMGIGVLFLRHYQQLMKESGHRHIQYGLGITFLVMGSLFFLIWILVAINYFKEVKTATKANVLNDFT